MHNVVRPLGVTVLAVAVALACRDSEVVRPHAPVAQTPPSPSGPRLATSTSGVTVLDLGSEAVAYAINASGAVAGQSGLLAAAWSPTGVMRIIHAPCQTCCNPGSAFPPGCSNTCDQYCTTNPAHDWPAAALGINDAGDVVGYYHVYVTLPAEVATDYQAGFLAAASGAVVDVGALFTGPFYIQGAAREVTARDINTAGQIVGRSNARPNGMQHGFLRSPSGGMTDLGLLLVPGQLDTWADAYAMNDAGDAVGYIRFPAGEHAARWRAGGTIEDLAATYGELGSSRAVAINNVGVAVGYAPGGGAVRWDAAGAVQTLGIGGQANAINDSGYIAGTSGSTAAVLTPAGTIIPLGTLGGAQSVAYAINNSRQVAGKAQDAAGVWHAVRWDLAAPVQSPIVIALYDTTPGSIEGMDVVVTGSATGDAMLQPVWRFDDGTVVNDWYAFHRYADNGTYSATLTVTGLSGATSSATATITILNAVPDVVISSGGGPLHSGDSTTLAAIIRDRGALDTPWAWRVDWGDGRESTGSLTSIASPLSVVSPPYCAPGTYTIHLYVTDKDGGQGSSFIGVVVQPITATITARGDGITVRPGGMFTVTVLGSAQLDVTRIDPASVTLDVGGTTLQVATRGSGQPFATTSDANGDGFTDLSLRFERRTLADAGIATDPLTPVTLAGRLTDGCGQLTGATTLSVVGLSR